MSDQVKYVLDESRLPEAWYNIAADLPAPPPPVLHPGTGQPVGPDDLAPLFPMAIIGQEVSTDRLIAIPEEVRSVYRQWRPTPLYRARRLESALETPARIYYKYEGVSPTGSHKPNTAVAQAYYNKQEGVKRLTTETGAGQWGSALAFAGGIFGLEVDVWMVRVSYDQKPYRRGLIEAFGGRVIASPSEETNAGRAILAEHPDSTGSLGMAISEAVEAAAPREDTKYSLGSVLNHVLMHQTVIGEEAQMQMDETEDYPDILIGCTGGGSNFSGLTFPFIGRALREEAKIRVIAVEPAACPSLTKGVYAFDFGDTGHLTPLVKMHTLGSTFVPPPFHAGGLRYHGMAPLVSHLHELGLIEARAYTQTEVFAAGVEFARDRGDPPGAGGEPRGEGGDRRGRPLPRGGRVAGDPLQPLRARPLRHAGVHRLRGGFARGPRVLRGGGRARARGASGGRRLRHVGGARRRHGTGRTPRPADSVAGSATAPVPRVDDRQARARVRRAGRRRRSQSSPPAAPARRLGARPRRVGTRVRARNVSGTPGNDSTCSWTARRRCPRSRPSSRAPSRTSIWPAGSSRRSCISSRDDEPVVVRNLLAELAERVDVRLLSWKGAPLPLFKPSHSDVREMLDALARHTKIEAHSDGCTGFAHCHHEKTIVIDGTSRVRRRNRPHARRRRPVRLAVARRARRNRLARRRRADRGPGCRGRRAALPPALARGDA